MYVYATGVHPFTSGAPRTIPTIAGVIARCLCQSPDERFASAGEIASALDGIGADGPQAARRSTTIWRTHQLIIMLLYIVAPAVAWQIKDWIETPVTVAAFIALGALATIGGVFRGHLVFTERMNPANLASERRRATRAIRLVDLAASALLLVAAVIVAQVRALPGLVTVSLALGIALAALVLEPATTRAAFGESHEGR